MGTGESGRRNGGTGKDYEDLAILHRRTQSRWREVRQKVLGIHAGFAELGTKRKEPEKGSRGKVPAPKKSNGWVECGLRRYYRQKAK